MTIQHMPSGKPVIPIELAGKGAILMDRRYSDEYLAHINAMYPLKGMLGGLLERMLTVEEHLYWSLTSGSPLGNDEGEHVLRDVLRSSARETIWQPYKTIPQRLGFDSPAGALEYLSKDAVPEGQSKHDYRYGAHIAASNGFVFPTAFQKYVVLLPSQAFVEHVASQARSISQK
jgi:hypothetical protein